MYIYLTSGTPEFMEKLRKKHQKENMLVLHGTGNSLLLHETEGKTKFSTPRKFEVISQANTLEQRGYFVLNNIPVAEEGRPLFEKNYANRIVTMENEPGFIAYRLLRPIKSDIYIVLSQWVGPNSYEAWKKTNHFSEPQSNQVVPGMKKQNIFDAASYITTYSGKLSEEK